MIECYVTRISLAPWTLRTNWHSNFVSHLTFWVFIPTVSSLIQELLPGKHSHFGFLNPRHQLFNHSCMEPKKVKVLVTQSCLTLCDPMDGSSPDSSVHRTLQARILKWVTIPFSRGSSQPKDRTQVSHIAGRFFTIWPQRNPKVTLKYLQLLDYPLLPLHLKKKNKKLSPIFISVSTSAPLFPWN